MFPSLSTPPQAKDRSSVSLVSELTSGVILRNVNQMMEHFQEEMGKLPEVCKSSFSPGVKLYSKVEGLNLSPTPNSLPSENYNGFLIVLEQAFLWSFTAKCSHCTVAVSLFRCFRTAGTIL